MCLDIYIAPLKKPSKMQKHGQLTGYHGSQSGNCNRRGSHSNEHWWSSRVEAIRSLYKNVNTSICVKLDKA